MKRHKRVRRRLGLIKKALKLNKRGRKDTLASMRASLTKLDSAKRHPSQLFENAFAEDLSSKDGLGQCDKSQPNSATRDVNVEDKKDSRYRTGIVVLQSANALNQPV